MNLLSLLGINLTLGSTEMVSLLLIWVIALMLVQTILIIVLLVQRGKNQTVVVKTEQPQTVVVKTEQPFVQQTFVQQPVEQKENVQQQVVQKVVEEPVAEQPVKQEQPAKTVVEEPVEEEVVEEPAEVVEEEPIVEEVEEVEDEEEDVEEELVEDEEEEIEEEDLIEEEEEQEEEAASAIAVAEEIEEEEEEEAVEEFSLDDDDEEEEDLDDEEDSEEDEEEEEEIGEIEIGGKALRPKYAYPTRIRLISDKTKFFYTKIKNEFLSYGFKNRISKTKENFNFSRDNVARFVVRGKTLKLYIALDPNSLDNAYYHHKDMSAKKTYAEIPTMVRIKSGRGTKKAIELVGMLAENLGLKKKRRFQDKDFSADLTAKGLTYIERKGFGYLMKPSVTIEDVQDLPEELAERFAQTSKADKINRFIRTKVALDELASKFEDGETVTIEAVRARGIGGRNANCLIVEDGAALNKKLKVYADEFTPNAVKMIALCGGEAFKIEREQ